MKLYKSILFAAMLTTLAACSDDGYWDAYVPGADGTGSSVEFSFTQNMVSVTLLPSDQPEVRIQIVRSTTKGDIELPVAAMLDEGLSGPEVVKFEDGSSTADYVITVSDDVIIGEEYNGVIAFAEEATSVTGINMCEVTIKKDYTWVDAGSCLWTSDLLGGTGRVRIEKAQEAEGLYRAVSPWAAIDPEEVSGNYPFEFTLDEDYNAATIPNMWTDFGLLYSSTYGNLALLYHPSYGAAFYNNGNEFHIEGAYGLTAGYIYSQGASETFVWDENYPGEE
ncbi:MAG: hypothetical protein IJS89_03100 [Bacteroidaceae bacterium]|nr:hypothetical protein [Bacteroidaceae bacterium]